MIVQIYAMTSVEDAVSVAKLGADYIGIVVSYTPDLTKGIISFEIAKEIIDNIRVCKKKSTVIFDIIDIDQLMKSISLMKMDILHICKETDNKTLLEIKDLISSYGIKLMYAIPVASIESVKKSLEIQDIVDLIMLDSPGLSKQMEGFVGATGRTHDWSISRQIVDSVKKPVILGGGLSPYNVQDAIKTVKPYGVDAKTSLDIPDGNGKKDIKKVEEFIRKVRALE
jgi:phosphoribosylanthranilate isomerase